MKYDKDKYVKSNDLVQASINNFNVAQNKLMTVLLTAYVNNYDKDSMVEDKIRISKYDLANTLGYTISGQTYDNIDKTLDRFAQNSMVKWLDDKGGTNRTPIFISVRNDKLEDENCMIEFQWNPLIKPHLTDMKDKYTTLVASNFLSLKSKKSQTLYEFFHSYVNLDNGFITVPIDKLKELTECTSQAYNKFTNFYHKGIKLPLEEINDKTDINVEVISKNKGNVNKRIIISITFRVTNQQAKKAWFEEYPDILLTEDQYKILTQDFNIGGIWIGKKLVNKLHEVKQKKPDSIHNDFKQLEKYYQAEVRKFEKESSETPEDKTKVSQLELYQMLEDLKNGKL